MEIAGTQGAQSVTDILQALQAALADHYVLERELGRGGMATVFLAKDLRHARPVAIKVLHPELAAVLGAQRFLAEIRTTAALQHPHILPLFDSGSIGGLLYYVMPYVEGETLRGRLARERQLPLVDSVRIVTAVATALEYAHRHGVIHRDIKPENILLGEDGHALVADFGIALAVSEAAGERLTQSGLSLGTPQYMAPEQAAGERALDARADVYALGAVLYEMLAGEPPFTGPTPQGVIARVMTEEPPPLTRHRRSVPPHVDAVVRTALEKVPADRYPTAAAFAAALSPAATIQGLDTRVARPAPRSRRVTVTLAAGTFIAAAAIGWTLGRTSSHASLERSPVRFTIELDSGAMGFGESAGFGELAISPDGRTVVFSAEVAEGTRLYMRRLDEISVRPLAGTEDADAPFFSPDGAWIAFYSNGAIRKMRLDGGAPVPMAQLPSPARFGGGAWGSDDIIYFALQPAGTLWRVSAAGGPATRVAVADTALRLVNPHPLPGGRALLVTVVQSASFNAAHVGVLDLASGHLRRFNPGEGARYVAGSIVYGTVSGELYGQPYDVGRLEPSGSPEQIASGLPNGYSFDVSDAGALAYRVGRRRSDYVHGRLTLTDSAGRVQRIIQARVPWLPRFSPDGRRLVFGAYAPGRDSSDVWVVNDLETGTTERLTTDGNDNNNPVWSPDGQRIAFSTLAPGGKDVVVKAIDGGPASPLVRRAGNQWPTDWVRDGSAVLFSEQVRAGGQDIWVQRLQAGEPFGAAHPYVASQAAETGARVSPDGRWVAYQSDETGRVEVYVQSYPTPGRKTLVSTAGGTNPIWHRDGRTLYYWKGDQLVAARLEVDGAGSPIAVRSRALRFRAPYVQHDAAMYDVSPDGKRFAIVMSESRPGRLVVALDVLGRRAESRGGRERTNAP